jgi:hypothetical protein
MPDGVSHACHTDLRNVARPARLPPSRLRRFGGQVASHNRCSHNWPAMSERREASGALRLASLAQDAIRHRPLRSRVEWRARQDSNLRPPA